MHAHRDSYLTKLTLFVFFGIAALYALFEIRGQILGPMIVLDTVPAFTNDSFVHIQGQATRISSLSMDGAELTVTESGKFDEPYVLAPGYNRIALDAKDAYGNMREKIVEIVYNPPPAPSQPLANTIASSSQYTSHPAQGLRGATTSTEILSTTSLVMPASSAHASSASFSTSSETVTPHQ